VTQPDTSLSPSQLDALLVDLSCEQAPGAAAEGAVHVLYGGAHLYRADSAAKLAAIARSAMNTWGADDGAFASLMGLDAAPPALAAELARRVRKKLERAAVEKLCIDFEDGFGLRPDAEEDSQAVRAAGELGRAPAGGPVVGLRIKALSGETARRAARTLDLFVSTLARATSGVPPGFTVTLPKVARVAEVRALCGLLASLERSLRLPARRIGVELMVETPRALFDRDGRVALPALLAAADGRCVAAHLGAYDLLAQLGVTAGAQRLPHPACEAARLLMQLALAGTGVAVVDGATTTLPLPRHRAPPGATLGEAERAVNEADVHAAWSLHARAVRSALSLGIYQGWDLHPAQLPARYGATYAFFLAERAAMASRLRAFVGKATQATLSGQVFDDAATGQGLLNFFARGVACGALDDADVTDTGLSLDEVRGLSFARIVEVRGARP
jgi:hypothetical protein